jgi:hypothetical protein
MGSRKITVTVELCDPDTGERDITVEDPDNPEPEWRYQDMVLHPAALSLLHELLGRCVTDGSSLRGSVSLNKPAAP